MDKTLKLIKFLLLFIFTIPGQLTSQSNVLVPFLDDDLYGLSNEKGNIIVKAKYTDIIPIMEDKLFFLTRKANGGF